MRIIGAAEGVIMPTIITVHMANKNAKSITRHGACAGVMSPVLMSMPPMSMSAASHSR
jgi:hypothetical protein